MSIRIFDIMVTSLFIKFANETQKRFSRVEPKRLKRSEEKEIDQIKGLMSFYGVAVGAIITGVGATLGGISAFITGIQSTKSTNSAARSTLLASCFTVLIGVILFLVTLVLFFMYQRKKKRGGAKALGITVIVLAILSIALLVTGATIAGVESNTYKTSNTVVYNALRTAAVLVGVGVLLMLIGYGILYLVIGRRTGGK